VEEQLTAWRGGVERFCEGLELHAALPQRLHDRHHVRHRPAQPVGRVDQQRVVFAQELHALDQARTGHVFTRRFV